MRVSFTVPFLPGIRWLVINLFFGGVRNVSTKCAVLCHLQGMYFTLEQKYYFIFPPCQEQSSGGNSSMLSVMITDVYGLIQSVVNLHTSGVLPADNGHQYVTKRPVIYLANIKLLKPPNFAKELNDL